MGEDKFEEERFMKALVNLKETQESIQVIRGVVGDGVRVGGILDLEIRTMWFLNRQLLRVRDPKVREHPYGSRTCVYECEGVCMSD